MQKLLKYTVRIIISSLCILLGSNILQAAEKQYVVVIDAGHGGKDAGAVDNNVREKDINLGVALKLGDMIKKNMKNVKVVYTRDDDSFISLQDRAKKSNDAKADLFISIHTNSVAESNPNRRTVAGSQVYALGLHKDEANMEVARRENAVIELEKNYEEKYSGFDPNCDESYILFEMTQKKKLEQSLKFAKTAQENMVKEAARVDRGVHQAGFWVLWATSAPAVLVELDFICNPNSAKYIASTTGQEKLAKGLFDAVADYIAMLDRGNAKGSRAEVEKTQKVEEEAAVPVARERRRHTDSRAVDTVAKKEEKSTAKTERRRRNNASLESSNNRTFEVPEIIVASEEETATLELADNEKNVAEVKTVADDKKSQSSSKKKEQTRPSRSDRASDGKHHVRVEKMRTIYRIQILVSETELKNSSPLLEGFSPVTVFKEKGLYKYTYGESENRKDMEKLLGEVRQRVPDAIIIKSRK